MPPPVDSGPLFETVYQDLAARPLGEHDTLAGWPAITGSLRTTERTLKKWARRDGLPIIVIGRDAILSQRAFLLWLMERERRRRQVQRLLDETRPEPRIERQSPR